MAAGEHGTKAVVAAMLANGGIAIAKFVGFLITGASSLLAESVHSVADTGNQGLLLLGGRRARKEETPEHPFGYGRERYFWAFVVAVILFALGSLFSFYEGFEKIGHADHQLESPGVGIAILLFAVVLESWSFRTAIVEANKIRHGTGWVSFVRHTKNPEIAVVLLEDLGALLGLFLALAGIGLSIITDDAIWDAYATLGIATLLGVISIVLTIEMKSLLIGESAGPADLAEIRTALASQPEVRRVIHMRTEHLGPDELLVAAKLDFTPELQTAEVAEAINRTETAVRDAVPAARVIYLEPDLYDTAVDPVA